MMWYLRKAIMFLAFPSSVATQASSENNTRTHYECWVRSATDHFVKVPQEQILFRIDREMSFFGDHERNADNDDSGAALCFRFQSDAKNTSIYAKLASERGLGLGPVRWYVKDIYVKNMSLDISAIQWNYIRMFYQIQKKEMYFLLVREDDNQPIDCVHDIPFGSSFYVHAKLKRKTADEKGTIKLVPVAAERHMDGP